jgi:hypothetical protein
MVRLKPVAMASTEISTATTPAMPTTMTEEVPRRCGMLLRFIAGDGADLSEHAHEQLPAQRPASASMMLSRVVRQAGGRPVRSASSTATAEA